MKTCRYVSLAVPFLLLPQIALAQSTPASAPASAEGNAPVQLSPFLVSTEGDEGYRAANTLSGTRMNASLFRTPAAISVLTKEFLDDIGAENVADMLKFAMSSDNERTDSGGGLAQAWDVRATIRGFTEAVITRDYLPNMVQGRGILANDRFNVDRADVSRGQSLDLQLNVENIFGQEDRLPFSATAPDVIVRYILPRVRHNWTMRATYGF